MTVKDNFLTTLKNDKSVDWERKNLSTRTLVVDVLYTLAMSVDSAAYAHADGFEKFLMENGVILDLAKEKVEKPI
jgi:hypothetical protein